MEPRARLSGVFSNKTIEGISNNKVVCWLSSMCSEVCIPVSTHTNAHAHTHTQCSDET